MTRGDPNFIMLKTYYKTKNYNYVIFYIIVLYETVRLKYILNSISLSYGGTWTGLYERVVMFLVTGIPTPQAQPTITLQTILLPIEGRGGGGEHHQSSGSRQNIESQLAKHA